MEGPAQTPEAAVRRRPRACVRHGAHVSAQATRPSCSGQFSAHQSIYDCMQTSGTSPAQSALISGVRRCITWQPTHVRSSLRAPHFYRAAQFSRCDARVSPFPGDLPSYAPGRLRHYKNRLKSVSTVNSSVLPLTLPWMCSEVGCRPSRTRSSSARFRWASSAPVHARCIVCMGLSRDIHGLDLHTCDTQNRGKIYRPVDHFTQYVYSHLIFVESTNPIDPELSRRTSPNFDRCIPYNSFWK